MKNDLPLSSAAMQDQTVWMSSASDLEEELGTDTSQGLSSLEAQKRLVTYGRNEVRESAGDGPFKLLVAQFRNILVWVLIGAAIVAGALGEGIDAIAITAIVVLNIAIGFYQEYRAENAMTALRRLTAPHARVIRDGKLSEVAAATVVSGDLLVLEAGDLVPADARLLEVSSLCVNESPLTGESVPVEKHAEPLPDPTLPLAERANMLFLGTSVVAGRGHALVVETGMRTEMGRIALLLTTTERRQTPLERRLNHVGRLLLSASLGIVVLVLLLGLWRGEALLPMLLTAVSLAVAAVPEGLPTVVTVALALGVSRMLRRKALVRRLAAVETLGSVQVICTDKTGTLTAGEMTVRNLWVGGRHIEVTGEGYEPVGDFLEEGRTIAPQQDTAVHALLLGGTACNEAVLDESAGTVRLLGDPTEGALLTVAAKAGIRREGIESAFPRERDLPFDSERKRMTIIRRTPTGLHAHVKGAPDLLLARCDFWLDAQGKPQPLSDEIRQSVLDANGAMAERALRVIAVAERAVEEDEKDAPADRLETGLTLVGLLGMYDPPRPEAREAVTKCHRAGIRVVMITGDHPATANAVAKELGITDSSQTVVAGWEIQQMTAADLASRVDAISVYARVTAEDKLRIVRALKARGRIVAMTGDGVNDAPAIKEADIGIAMGKTGTEVTKEAADMVVTDDNFASIVAAVEEGRGIYDNIRKCLHYLLAGNLAELVVVLAAVILGWPIPLAPLQLLWINLVTDGLPALTLAVSPANEDVLNHPPRPADAPLMDAEFLRATLLSAVFTASLGLLAFWYGYRVENDLSLARTYAFTGIVYAELLRSLGLNNPYRPVWKGGLVGNPYLLAVVALSVLLQFAILHLPAVQRVFAIQETSVQTCLILLLLASIPLVMMEWSKQWTTKSAKLSPATPPS